MRSVKSCSMIQRWSLIIGAMMMMGFDAIPGQILTQEKTREHLLLACAKALKSVDDPTFKDVDLAVCQDHQSLAKKMMGYIQGSSDFNVDGEGLIRHIADAIIDVNVKSCYARVKRGEHFRDRQGRIGIAACDRMTEDQRHRLTLQAIEDAKLEALSQARIKTDMRRR